MRIKRLIIKNYRQFKQAEISFPKRHDTDLHFIIGTNGTGKTNILNAINWCLYGDEPHLSKESQTLPLINLKTVDKKGSERESEMAIEVWAEAEDHNLIYFIRKAKFLKTTSLEIERQGETFEVRYVDELGNTKIVQDESADVWVERFVPKNIREFFFFDGERLDHYFKEATGQNIRHAVFQISQLDLLENCIERKLQGILDDLRKEAGKANPKIESARTELERLKVLYEDFKKRFADFEGQIAIAKSNICEYDEKLKGVPDIIKLEEEREHNIEGLKNTKELLVTKQNEKKSYLLDAGKLVLLLPAINNTIKVILEKKNNKDFPPPIDKKVLEDVVQSGTCIICGQKVDEDSKKKINEMLLGIKTSSDSAIKLVQMEIPLNNFLEDTTHFKEQLDNYSQEIAQLEKLLSNLTERNNQIDKIMSGYNEDLVREWYSERSKFEDIRDKCQIDIGGFQVNIQRTEGELSEAQKVLDDELGKEIKVKELNKKLAFCEKSLEIARLTRERIMKETREKIENETRRQFFNLIWKRETFENIKINEDYSIHLFHKLGFECLGSVSAGEREMLALSFTLALHKASGFDSPILIDTPVARISDINRTNFGNVLCEVSTTKQIVLLLTPNEYSEELRTVLGGRASGRYKLILSSDETEAKVEVM